MLLARNAILWLVMMPVIWLFLFRGIIAGVIPMRMLVPDTGLVSVPVIIIIVASAKVFDTHCRLVFSTATLSCSIALVETSNP